MRWLGSCSYGSLLLLSVLTACRDDPPTSADGTDTDVGTGPGTATDTEGVDETADPDTTAGTGEPTGEPPPEPCIRNDDCEDGNACTEDVCNSGVCEVGDAVISNECRPTIDVDFPPRAATLQDDSPVVTVTGTVHSGAGPIASLTLNGEDVEVAADGSFSHDVTAQVGGNTLVFETLDTFDQPRKRVQSFLWSPSYRLPTVPENGITDEGLAIYLDQPTLDDGNHNPPPNDVATLLGLALETVDLQQFINPGVPITSSAGYNVYLTTIQHTDTDVALEAIDGGIELQGFVYGISGDLVFDCTIPACQLAGGDGTGDMTIDSIRVTSDLLLSVNANNQVVVTSANTQTNVVNLDITSNNAWTNFLITVIEPFIIGGVVADIEAELTMQVDSLLGPALSQAFNGLAPNSVLQFPNLADPMQPIEVELVTDFFATDFHDGASPPAGSPPQGGVIVLRGGGYAVAPVAPYENLGIPDRYGCGDGSTLQMPRDGLLEIGLTDDLLNQLLHGAWEGGLLEFDMPPELLPANGLISDVEIHVSGMLAPTASDCSPDAQVRAHLGDVRIEGSLMLGMAPITFTAYSTLLAGLEFTPTSSGVAITISEVEQVDTELTVNEDDSIETEPLLASTLETQLVDGVLGAIASGGLGAIDLPQIDLSPTLGLPPGTAQLTITTTQATRAPGVTVIVGHL
ncbi:hypothetical protein [Paraliomyxa miuraensis]|uniref:hypothetical protein n=1 Tax=Paraliomyxa miuraensis TaxID=376150 RepID=UPI002254A94B|nr:hypothetical protein [Paraliomyxa miuraensis]MCX4241713.1 hypothetical protein [Paraliomyxa miuraensis]